MTAANQNNALIDAGPKDPKDLELDAVISDVRRLGLDFAGSLGLFTQYAQRCPGMTDTHLFFKVSDLLIHSGLAASFLVVEGMRNAGRREARFLVEASIKLLFTDQSMPKSSLADRLVFFERRISASGMADELKGVRFEFLEGASAKDLRNAALRLYGRLSEFVHISHEQIMRHLDERKQGLTIGFDTAATVEEAAADLFAVYDISLVACLHAIGHSPAGDLMMAWQNEDWAFHAAPFISALDKHYDYKAERKAALASLATKRESAIRSGWRAPYQKNR